MQPVRNLFLRENTVIIKPIPKGDNLLLPRVKNILEYITYAAQALGRDDARKHIFLINPNDIHQADFIPFPVGPDRLIQRYLPCLFALLAEPHQKLVLNAAARVGNKLGTLVGIVCIDRFDQSDCTYGDQVFRRTVPCLIFLDDMRHQTQIVFHKDITRGDIASLRLLQILRFFFGRERVVKSLHGGPRSLSLYIV